MKVYPLATWTKDTVWAYIRENEIPYHPLHDVGYRSIGSDFDVPVRFKCSCSRERALAPLQLFSPQELAEIIQQEGGSEVTCQYCGMKYQFSGDEILAMMRLPDA